MPAPRQAGLGGVPPLADPGNPLDPEAAGPYLQAVTTPPDDDERFEHIPWEQVGRNGDRNKLILYGLAGAILIAGLTAALVGGRRAPAELVPTPTTTASATVTTMIEATTAATPSTAPGGAAPDNPAATGQPRAWSEADLLAFPVETLAAEAAAIAEWLASDFFTMDGGTQISDDLERFLPSGASLPAGPTGARSYVEWARAVSVKESVPGLYEVLVVVRRLSAADGEGYQRIAPIGVVVTLSWTEQGWSMTDLPALSDAPLLVQAPAWAQSEVPEEIAAASTAGEVLGGVQVGENWRLVVRVVDPIGVSWPMVIWSDGSGNRIPVPSPSAQP